MGSVRADIAYDYIPINVMYPTRENVQWLAVYNYGIFATGSVRADIACGYIPMSGAELL